MPLDLERGDWVVLLYGREMVAAEVMVGRGKTAGHNNWTGTGAPRRYVHVRVFGDAETIQILPRQVVHVALSRGEAQQFIAKENER